MLGMSSLQNPLRHVCSCRPRPGWSLILVITGIVLSSVYRNAAERAFDRRLNLYLRTLIAEVATPDDADRTSPIAPVARRAAVRTAAVRLVLADRPNRHRRKAETRASRSLWDARSCPSSRITGRNSRPPGSVSAMSTVPKASESAHGGAAGRSRRRRQILGSASPATPPKSRRRPGRSITIWLAPSRADGIGLLLTTIFQVRFGLAPLKRISESLADIRSGQRGAAGGRVSGRDRAAGARDQCAARRQPRDRRARAHPCRQSRPCDQDAALGHRQRGGCASPASRSPTRSSNRRT
jgi:hypothetical protein